MKHKEKSLKCKMKLLKHIIPLLVLFAVWGGIALFCWLKPEDDFSVSERRRLASLPAMSVDSVLSGEYFRDFEEYSLDQFPLRDAFRVLKSVSEFYLFGKSDNHDIYISDGYAVKIEYPLDKSSVRSAVKKLNYLYETYLSDVSGNIYLSVIPDKGYFSAEQTEHPAMDYQALFDIVKEGMPYAKYMDVTSMLELSDYYKTDSHWRQEKIRDVAEYFADSMGASVSGKYEEHVVEKPFYGVYLGQAALLLENDRIHYLSNDTLEKCTLYNEETKETTGLYHFEKLESRDMYEIYLSGASPLLSIKNPIAEKEKKLIVFRDSFASSLIPLLAEGYSEITLVDTRYMSPTAVGDYVDFAGADILFLYSTTVLNNSETLR
ncbi:MAG: DHHW family protein [Lachnospiraceae bacterium]|nr:DHHW family protein [Lachnospiraceae bacterium]